MTNNHKVRFRGATVSEGERIRATSLEHQYKNIWVRGMCFIHINKEQEIATPLNAIGIPIIPEDFQPPIKLVQKYRKWFKKTMKAEMKFFQQWFYSTPITFTSVDKDGNIVQKKQHPKSLKHAFGSVESYLDNLYHDRLKLHQCKSYREWAEHVWQGSDEETIETYAKQCNKEREERLKDSKLLNPIYSALD
tara:strand:+ start:347 stop:922 length:576 start_codon:yes stop_codon:yes gene_type:complete